MNHQKERVKFAWSFPDQPAGTVSLLIVLGGFVLLIVYERLDWLYYLVFGLGIILNLLRARYNFAEKRKWNLAGNLLLLTAVLAVVAADLYPRYLG